MGVRAEVVPEPALRDIMLLGLDSAFLENEVEKMPDPWTAAVMEEEAVRGGRRPCE